MATAPIQEICRETEVWFRGRTERGHASGARSEDHKGPRRYVQQEIQT